MRLRERGVAVDDPGGEDPIFVVVEDGPLAGGYGLLGLVEADVEGPIPRGDGASSGSRRAITCKYLMRHYLATNRRHCVSSRLGD